MRPHPLVYRHRRATEDGLAASRESLTAKLRQPRRKITAWAV